LSALHALSTADGLDEASVGRLVYGALALCGGVAAAVTAVGLLATPALASLFPNVPEFGAAWLLAAPGLLPFALNKVLLGIINGLQYMRAFAVFQALRFVFLILSLAGIVIAEAPSAYLAAILTISETSLLFCLGIYVHRIVPPRNLADLAGDARRHAAFGLRVLPAALVAELNTRVDVLLLGALLNDRSAGIYTVAALINDAALQAVTVVRNNISPVLARDVRDGNLGHVLSFSRRLGAVVICIFGFGAACAVLLFPVFQNFAFPGAEFEAAAEPLFWLMLCLPISAALLSYSLVLSQAGRPSLQSLAMGTMLAINFGLNALLIPEFGIAGAGIATGLSGIIGGLFIITLARRSLGVRLFF
jgi:O-antigen/teichoic acid export membrane protein